MAKTPNYKYKEDPADKDSVEISKEDKFTYKRIIKANDFESWYNDEAKQYSEDKYRDKYIFRGVNEAKFKLFASSQRTWWNYDFVRASFGSISDPSNYIEFLKILMNKAREWNNGILDKYYKEFNTEFNDFVLLSLMQHNGLPTPLLDFTTDLDIALYFAFLKMEHVPSERFIDNCVSLYIIDKEQKSFLNLFDLYEEGEDKKLNIETLFAKKKLIYFSELNQKREIQIPVNIHSNFNILNQKGLFLFNHEPWKPVEMNKQFANQPYIQDIICIDIHKSLKEFILHKILENNTNLTIEYLFPNFDHFKDVTLQQTLKDFSP
jgi:hypothetical protein